MQILKAVVEPLIEQALAQVGITNDHWRSMLAPSRELDQGDLSLPCFPFAKQLGKAPPAIAEAVAEMQHNVLKHVWICDTGIMLSTMPYIIPNTIIPAVFMSCGPKALHTGIIRRGLQQSRIAAAPPS